MDWDPIHRQHLALGMACAIASCCIRPCAAESNRAAQGTGAQLALPATRAPEVPEVHSLPYWSHGEARVFASGRAVAGLGLGRVALNSGYGKPHWLWVGPEMIGAISLYSGSVQAGVHASAVVVDAMVTLRRSYSFSHGRVSDRATVTSRDLHASDASTSRYDCWDMSVWGFVPWRRLLVGWELTYARPISVASGELLYEEVQRAVIGQSGVWTTKLGPMLQPWTTKRYYAGLLAEQLTLVGRSRSIVLRLGPSVWLSLADHWDLYGYLTWPIHGPDALGFWDGMYGSVGVMYRFATGVPAPGHQ